VPDELVGIEHIYEKGHYPLTDLFLGNVLNKVADVNPQKPKNQSPGIRGASASSHAGQLPTSGADSGLNLEGESRSPKKYFTLNYLEGPKTSGNLKLNCYSVNSLSY
jgi:hypothetical protein